jgi:hypothetical protein
MLGRRAWDWWQLWAKSVPVLAAINSVNEAPEALNDYGFPKSSGSLAIFAAIRRAYAIADFFDTCARVKAERNVAVSIGSMCPKQTGGLRHVEALVEKKQTSE